MEARLFVSAIRPIDPHRTGCILTARGGGVGVEGGGGGGWIGPTGAIRSAVFMGLVIHID